MQENIHIFGVLCLFSFVVVITQHETYACFICECAQCMCGFYSILIVKSIVKRRATRFSPLGAILMWHHERKRMKLKQMSASGGDSSETRFMCAKHN